METPYRKGYPWAGSREIIEASDQALHPPGELAELRSARDEFLGLGTYHAGAAIAFRLLTTKKEVIDARFFKKRIEKALEKRDSLYDAPYYRLIHSEADGISGLTVDRFGTSVSLQVSTSGIERFLPHIVQALEETIASSSIILRNDIPARAREGLPQEVRVIKGNVPELSEVHENGCVYFANLLSGQKTGWFFDQRDNRKRVAELARGKSLLDAYSHSGGFGVLAAKEGAHAVTCMDSSALALSLAEDAAAQNGVKQAIEFVHGDALRMMEQITVEKRFFDVVVADPPAFIKSREHIASGMKGYAKVAAHAAKLVAPGGVLVIASCSHHATRARLKAAVMEGAKQAGVSVKLVAAHGAGADHPIHPMLPQSEYLNCLYLQRT